MNGPLSGMVKGVADEPRDLTGACPHLGNIINWNHSLNGSLVHSPRDEQSAKLIQSLGSGLPFTSSSIYPQVRQLISKVGITDFSVTDTP